MSLTRDFSVFIDLSGGRDLVNVLANGYYMHFGWFVKGSRTINRKNCIRIFYAPFAKGHSLTYKFALFFIRTCRLVDYMHIAFLVKGFWEPNPKQSRVPFYAYRSITDLHNRLVPDGTNGRSLYAFALLCQGF